MACTVRPYVRGSIAGLLSAHTAADAPFIATKGHVRYFDEYFDKCGAQTVVVEPAYVDRDYLEDFAGYYVRCFSPYERFATRLHFFSKAFSQLFRKNRPSIIIKVEQIFFMIVEISG